MAQVVFSTVAFEDLAFLIRALSLPATTVQRVVHLARLLETFPQAGASLHGRWKGFRFISGPWRWMILVYAFDAEADLVTVVTVHDARASSSVTSE